MRYPLLAAAAVIGTALAAPSFAQTMQPGGMATRSEQGAQSNTIIGRGEPYSQQASNIDGADMRSPIAPQLPVPPGGVSAAPQQLLRDAARDLDRGWTGAAQEALERAETRLLDARANPGPSDGVSAPVNGPMIDRINRALQALGHHDIGTARTIVASAVGNGGPMSASNTTTGSDMGNAMGAGGRVGAGSSM